MNKIKNENYIQISGWMRNNLELKGNELLLFSLIYGFCQDDETVYSGSLSYASEWIGCAKSTAQKTIDSLVNKRLIIKNSYVKNNITFCEYRVPKGIERCTENRYATTPKIGTPPIPKIGTNNNTLDITKDKLLFTFNLKASKRSKVVSDKVWKQFKSRLKEGYTFQNIVKAIENCASDKYHIENPKYLTLEFITRPDKLDKYLNANNKTVIKPNQKSFYNDLETYEL